MVGDACTISKEKHNQDVHMLENLPQTVLLHRSLNSDAGCTLIWCFTIKRKTKKKKKISPRLNLAPEPQQSQAWLPVELPWQETAECMLVFFLSKQSSVYDS